MEEILFALGLRSISSTLSMILPIVVIIAVVMIVSRLGAIRNHLFFIRNDISKTRHRKEMQDSFESFDRNLSMSEEEKAEEIAKDELFEHLQEEPIRGNYEFLQDIAGALVGLYFFYWIFTDFGWRIGWIFILLVSAGLYYVGEYIYEPKQDKKFRIKLHRWKQKRKKLQKNLNDLRK